MSYPMVHMEIAYRLLGRFDWLENRGDFLLGAVAPDSVHFREGYHPRMKEASHLWNCGPQWGTTTDSPGWKRNVATFWELHKADENRDFFAGYCAHILTDWLNDVRIWSPFRQEIGSEQIFDPNTRYRKEAYGIDQWLYHMSGNSGRIWELLREGKAYLVEGCARAEDMERMKESILSEQFTNRTVPDVSGYRCCTREMILAFLEECVEMIADELCP